MDIVRGWVIAKRLDLINGHSGGGFYRAREFVAGANHFVMLAQGLRDKNWHAYTGVFTPEKESKGSVYWYFGVSGAPMYRAEFDNLGDFAIDTPFVPPLEKSGD